MVAFELGVSKLFIRCLDTKALWVYELSTEFDNMGASAFEENDWTRCEGPIGPVHDYKCLKIGDQEIKGSNLKKLIKVLCYSRLIVNKDGCCFLDTVGLLGNGNNADEFQVQYQMVRRLFDWNSFQLINPRKNEEEEEEEEEEERGGEEEDKVSILTKRVADLEKELDERVFENSKLSIEDFFYEVVCRCRVVFPCQNFIVGSTEAKSEFTRAGVKRGEVMQIDETLTPMDATQNALPLPEVPVYVSKGEFDINNWWVITVATKTIHGSETELRRIVYYDDEIKRRRQVIGDRTIAVPFVVGSKFRFKTGCALHMIHGVGVRFVFFL